MGIVELKILCFIFALKELLDGGGASMACAKGRSLALLSQCHVKGTGSTVEAAHWTKYNPHLNSPGASQLLRYPKKLFLVHFFLESVVKTLLLNNAKTKTQTPLVASSAESGVLCVVQLPHPETMELHFFIGV